MMKARLRHGARWQDSCILNISSRGMQVLMGATPPPTPGSFVELGRGRHLIVGRVVWSAGRRIGVQTQDRLDVEAMVADPESAAALPGKGNAPPVERRRAPRASAQRHEQSRQHGRAIEFGSLALAVGAAAWFAASMVETALARPLGTIQAALHAPDRS